jgi:prephenate dehydratase
VIVKKIAFQGSDGANSHLASKKFYPDHSPVSFPTFSDVFDAVEKEEVQCGVIPLENSYSGRVSEIHNLLQTSNICIIAEHFFLVSHNLCALQSSSLSDIKEVYSHPQALMQCRKTLHILRLATSGYSNTADSAKFISSKNDKTIASLCSLHAAKINGLKVLRENMQDADGDNITIFIAISKNKADPNPDDTKIVTTLIFTIKNMQGGLYKALGGFATNGVDIIRLESYIPGGTSTEAKFFITIKGNPVEKRVALALNELRFFSTDIKLLGTYNAISNR